MTPRSPLLPILALTALFSAGAGPLAATPLQVGGEVGAAVTTAQHVYVGQGATIVTLAADGSSAPEVLDVTAPLPGLVRGLAVHQDVLYATWRTDHPNGRLALFSLADPAHPVWLADVAYSANPFLDPGELAVVGSTLYLTDAEVGLLPIDVSDPQDPVIGTPISTFGLRGLAPWGPSHLLAWGRNFFGALNLSVFDVSSPSSPSLVGEYGGDNHFDVVLGDGFVVLTGDGFHVVDLSDPANPALLAAETAPAFTGVVAGDHLLLGWEGIIDVWDLTNPASPTQEAPVPAPADRTRVIAPSPAAGETLWLTDRGRLLAVDVAVAGAPVVEHVEDLPVGTDVTGVATTPQGLLLADFYTGLRTIDPAFGSLGRLEPPSSLPAFEDVAVDGSLALLADWSFGVHTVDVTDLANPVLLGSVPFAFASALDLDGDRGWAVSSTNGGFFVSLDLSDPVDPQITSSTPISLGTDVHFDGSHVYVADDATFGTGGLRIYDVSGPTPLEVAHYTLCDSAGGVDVEASRAAVACHNGELHLLDVTMPNLPVQLGVYSDPSTFLQGSAALLDGAVAYFGHTGGLEIVDVSDPATPALLESVALPGGVRALDHAAGGGAWAAAGVGGVARVRAGLFADGFESGDTSAWSTTVN